MNLYVLFCGEGPTDFRFLHRISERIINQYLLDEHLDAEITWIRFQKKGSSHDNILGACEEARNYSLILFHRDADGNNWKDAYQNHFRSAIQEIQKDTSGKYNPNVIPIIPVAEIEAWMLCDKELLKSKIETTLSDAKLGLDYKIGNIESIRNPKLLIENVLSTHNGTLAPKRRKYSVQLEDLYDLISEDISIADIEKLDSFSRFKDCLIKTLAKVIRSS